MSSGNALNTLFQHMQANAAAFQQAYTERLASNDTEGAAQLKAQKELKEKTISEGVGSVFSTLSAWISIANQAQQLARG